MIRKIIVALALGCSVLAGCDHVDPTIAQKGAQVLDRVMPKNFTSFDIEYSGYIELCKAHLSLGTEKEWGTDSDELVEEGPRPGTENTELHAHWAKSGWVIDDSDADPANIGMDAFETRIQECVDTFRKWQKVELDAVKKTDDETEHNLKSWQASDAKVKG